MHNLDVLIPHFNDLPGLAASLASVRAQVWTGAIRAVVCDDGSRPEVREALPSVLADSGVDHLLVLNERNLGRPETRNRLLDAAEAPHVAWLDAGDLWKPGKIAAQFDALWAERYAGADPNAIWVTCNYDWKWEDRRARPTQQKTDGDQVQALLIGNTLRAYLWTLLGTRESFRTVGRFDPRLTRLQDLDYFLRFLYKGGRIVKPAAGETLCVYNKSDTGRDGREILACLTVLHEKHRTAIDSYGGAFGRTRRYNAFMHAARFAHNNRDRRLQAELMARALVTRPKLFARHLVRKGLVP